MKRNILVVTVVAVAAGAVAMSSCAATSHAVQRSALGTASSSGELLKVLDQPGPIEAETVRSVQWSVPLSGMLNLDNPAAKEAGLTDREEPIGVYFHVIKHPKYGTFIIDTGVENALRDDRSKAAIRGPVASFMHIEKMTFENPLGDWLKAHGGKLDGVFFTHLHLDHLSGTPDVPKGTPLYSGPGDASQTGLMNFATRGSFDRALEGQAPISEWPYAGDADGRFEGVVDVFGDGSLWAIQVPGHTKGSNAYIARTANGPILFTGDTCHTAWGWEHSVEPGTYTADQAQNRVNLLRLKKLAEEHPNMRVRLGHQALPQNLSCQERPTAAR